MSDIETSENSPSQTIAPNTDLSGPVATIVAAFAAREAATIDDVVELALRLSGLEIDWRPAAGTQPAPRAKATARAAATGAAPVPAVSLDNAITENSVFCLCCGRGFTMLKRHLKAEHNLTEEQYRAKFDLPEDFLLVAPSYSARKAAYAKEVGLGKYRREMPSVSAN